MDAASTLTKVMLFSRFLTLVAIIICHANLVFGAGILPPKEVDALRQIAKTIGKTWNFDVNPCSGEGNWVTDNENDAVNCSCSSGNDSVCHVIRMFLTSNNLTGELPRKLANLVTLKDFRIGDNQFVGSIPNFVLNWINIEKLVIQGSGLSGPIPLGNSSLTNLTDLRISDLNGNDSAFLHLANAKNLETDIKELQYHWPDT